MNPENHVSPTSDGPQPTIPADSSSSRPGSTGKPERPRRSPARRFLRAVGILLATVLILILAVITVAVNYLSPSRLTPLIERVANDYLRADVSIGRVEISFWHTFPRFDLRIDSLNVITHAFRNLPDSVAAGLPADADSLLSIARFEGAVNIPRLLAGDISLYDITIVSPSLNLIQATPEAWSLDIFPPSPEEDDKQDTPLSIPDISLGTFAITDGFPVRYRSIPDSLDISVNLTTTRLDGNDAPIYRLDVSGLTSASVSAFTINRLSLGLDGDIDWSARQPLRAGLSSVKARVGDVNMTLDATLDFADDLRVETFEFNLPPTPLSHIIALIPSTMRGDIEALRPEATIELAAHLTAPFAVGVDSIPSLGLHLNIPEGKASYDGLDLESFTLSLSATVDGDDPDKSVVSIDRLVARAPGMGFGVSGNATSLLSDPHITGTFRGGLGFAKLPRSILQMIPGKVSGRLMADCEFDLRQSYLSRDNFHRIRLTGSAELSDLDVDMPEIPINIYSRHADLRLGTNTSFVRDNLSADSLLTLSVSIDTLSANLEGIETRVGALKAGLGTRNVSSSIDTTRINPIGGRIEVKHLLFRDLTDSTRVFLRNATIGGALTRYKGNAREPQLSLNISSGTTFYGDSTMRAILRDLSSTMRVHPSDSPIQQRRWALADSLRRLYPGLTRDSISTLTSAIIRSERRSRPGTSNQRSATPGETSDDRASLEVDRTLKTILRRWNASGTLKAARMRLFTPLFPLRNSIDGLDMRFTTDSITLHETKVSLGRSDFRVSGSISNISRALTSRNGSQTLHADLTLSGDTIDVNEIAAATFAGAAYADSHTGAVYLDDAGMNEQALQSQVTSVSADTAGVLIIPSNIEAQLEVKARHILYSDLAFHDFNGTLNAFDGALNLSRLSARSDVGALSLNALYTAPSKNEASFAFDLGVDRLRIGQFLDLIPSIDSLMPALSGIDGVINATVAATSNLDSVMNLDIPSLKAAVRISGDSLVVLDEETFRTISRWLLFKDKGHNMIDSMTVEMLIDNSRMQMFPFIFNIDRYRLGVEGTNDLAMNLNYHIAVLKSPLPFRFGINITGNVDKMKIRLGRARFNEKNMPRTVAIADTTRINLVREIRDAFRRGVSKSSVRPNDFLSKDLPSLNRTSVGETSDISGDTISRADSLYFIEQGLLPPPPAPADSTVPSQNKKNKKSRK